MDVKLIEKKEQIKTTKLSDINSYMLCEAIEAVMLILFPKIQNPVEMFELLTGHDRSSAFPNLLIFGFSRQSQWLWHQEKGDF